MPLPPPEMSATLILEQVSAVDGWRAPLRSIQLSLTSAQLLADDHLAHLSRAGADSSSLIEKRYTGLISRFPRCKPVPPCTCTR